jgi:hypothetical protein
LTIGFAGFGEEEVSEKSTVKGVHPPVWSAVKPATMFTMFI